MEAVDIKYAGEFLAGDTVGLAWELIANRKTRQER
jgi:hypothetical protein